MPDELLDRKSIFSVFVECKASLTRMVKRYSNRQSDVEDILQEAFLNVYSADKNTPISFPKQYLFKATRNLAVRENTKVSEKLTEYIEDSDESLLLTDEKDIFVELAAQQEKELLLLAINQLPGQCRKVTQLRIIEGARMKDIAVKLNITVSTVEKHLAKGLELCDDFVREAILPASSDNEDVNNFPKQQGSVK
ncbi:sigma-70 family RNA polymerase sigma factor [Alteromonas sp. 1_MG-2023]|uniref:RNA polymerase sigma factor n=1 Tax=Alteromonas sp. 1_MG-2023 TaxID=3062669 RepID=UPI0026E2F0F5|nr:sigma-70 family RNA polymerase sigma factor [Alteromonas sp. 1_MG-2023]MDO6477566.1 sigma-70 family RNA polymerase sigma factor [Alteromonas sp. 1_MG-2023]